MRSRAGIRAVLLSLAILGVTALAQTAIFVATGSVALLADLVHNFGDAATAIPVGIAFYLRSFRAEKIAGMSSSWRSRGVTHSPVRCAARRPGRSSIIARTRSARSFG